MQTASSGESASPDQSQERSRRKRFRWSVFFGILFALAVGAAFWISANFEPRYHGVKLSVWLDRYYNEVDAEQQRNEASNAICQIGPRALPVAMRWLRATDSRFKERLQEMLDRQSVFHFKFMRAYELQERAESIFAILGPTAKPAVPELSRLINDTNVTASVARVLGNIGQDALPAVLIGLTNKNPFVRNTTANALVSDQTQPTCRPSKITLPFELLLKMIVDSEPAVHDLAAANISQAAQSKSITPSDVKRARVLLLHLVEDPEFFDEAAISSGDCIIQALRALDVDDRTLVATIEKVLRPPREARRWAVVELGKFGPTGRPAIPALLKSLGDNYIRDAALASLRLVGAESSQIISALEQTLSSPDISARIWSATVLGSYGAKAKTSVPFLLQAAAGQDKDLRTAVYVALQNIDPVAAKANAKTLDVNYLDPVMIPLLVKTLSHEDPIKRRVAADCLAKFGQDASVSASMLVPLLEDKNETVRAAAADALKKVDPKIAAEHGIK